MKKKYANVDVEIIEFDSEDVITTSPPVLEESETDPTNALARQDDGEDY